MANISDLLNKIKSARYGRDVRSAIYDSIDAMNTESANAYDAAITAQNSAQASAKAASGSVTSATEAAINAKKYSDSAKQYAESASVAIQAAYDTKTTTDKHITNAVDAPMMVTKFTKNLLNPALVTTTSNGVTCTKNSDGTYTLNGTATARTFFNINSNIPIIKGVAYKVVCIRDEDIDPGKFLSCVRRKATSAEYIFNNGTFIADTDLCWLWIEVEKDKTMNNVTIKPMLTTDLEATYDDYVPYSGYEIKTCGKNLLPISSIESRTVNGVTFTNNGDGTWTLNGTATGSATLYIFLWGCGILQNLRGKKFVVIGTKGTNVDSEAYVQLSLAKSGQEKDWYKNYSTVRQISDDVDDARFEITVKKGFTCNNLIAKPMITDDTSCTYDDFEPYEGTSIQVTNDTQEPVYGLNSYEGITHVISDGKVTSSYALTDTGKYVMQCMKSINDLKAAAATSA